MKAKDISGHAPGGARTRLADVLPLDTPYVVQFFPIYACNFKCKYCVFSSPVERRGFISDKAVMDFNLFKKCVDDMATFPNKIRLIRFVGMGEPLLHKNIADMVKYTVDKGLAGKVEILTNASLLTPELSDALVSAGLARLVISLQGTSAEKYKAVSDIDLDFDKFIGNIRYLYEHRGNLKIHIKIIDYGLEGKEDEERFFKLFGDICDTIGIEHAGPIFPSVDYDPVLKGKAPDLTQFGLPVSEVAICPQPFFTLQINPDGKIVPCYSILYPMIMGDANNESVKDIWNGRVYRDMRRRMLDGTKAVCKVCEECNIIKHRLFPEDDLRNDAQSLKKLFQE